MLSTVLYVNIKYLLSLCCHHIFLYSFTFNVFLPLCCRKLPMFVLIMSDRYNLYGSYFVGGYDIRVQYFFHSVISHHLLYNSYFPMVSGDILILQNVYMDLVYYWDVCSISLSAHRASPHCCDHCCFIVYTVRSGALARIRCFAGPQFPSSASLFQQVNLNWGCFTF